MTKKTLLNAACAALLATTLPETSTISAQGTNGDAALVFVPHLASAAPPENSSGAAEANPDRALSMAIKYGKGFEKRRRSHHGVMEPVGVPLGNVVEISLEFPKTMVGVPVVITPLDGGQITASQQPLVVGANGTADFSFAAGATAGLYRLRVRGAQECELHLYAFDPNKIPSRRNP